MICPICHKKETTQTVTRKFNGAQIIGEVCDDCVDEALSLDNSGFYYVFISQHEKTCRYCKRKLSEIEATYIVGCRMCYKEFAKELQPMIAILQGDVE